MHHFLYTDKVEFHGIELSKLPEGLKEGCSDVESWARFISAEQKEEFDMLPQKIRISRVRMSICRSSARIGRNDQKYEAR